MLRTRGIVAAVESGVGRYVVTGLVSVARASVILAQNDAWMSDEKLPAQVADYSGAVLLLPPDALHQAARNVRLAQPRGGLGAPTALVVPKDSLESWRLYCWLMAQCGVMRAAFSEPEQARRWAISQAALWAAERDHLRRGR